ncbi:MULTISPECIES: TetR/AcrR family transcriptional regulator [Inquilinus]|uniref:AcrR family transcriptional regulator n=1 Tax=Inquilinus ginsengisoli TaxID=363840 RepID=A0ABU1JX66_9PROT|nr:TetR/AcrR family transcriptional regulator [Inquilinus ginsengisoli]MDR6292140.1 AcrR family transcriptional regulator [Inquilinus ginsengisoli]
MSEQDEIPRAAATPRGRRKREAILAAGLKVFMAEGYAASMDRVAAGAGVAKQTLYSHFGSKEGLLRAVSDRFKHDTLRGLDPAGDLGAELLAFGDHMMRKLFDPETLGIQRLMIAQADAFPDLARIVYAAGPGRVREALVEFMRSKVEQGELRPVDPDEAAEDFVALLQGGRRQRYLFGIERAPDAGEIRRMAQRAVAVFRRAYTVS